ncbi:hypothetical protein ART_1253 [Arthrobacter sp. PAMC 25486]|nr:hypothetical protein ART_1253 [Arthrobacter sp. PAMC 25486]
MRDMRGTAVLIMRLRDHRKNANGGTRVGAAVVRQLVKLW